MIAISGSGSAIVLITNIDSVKQLRSTMSTGETKKPKNLRNVPLNLIHESPVMLRKVDYKDPEFIDLCTSVAKDGILQPILLREVRDGDGNLIYGLINGAQRFAAAKLANLEEIPALIRPIESSQLLEAMLLSNVQLVKTKPAQVAKAMKQIFKENPLMTLKDMATKMSKSTQWVQKMLEITDLPENILKMVDDGTITLSNAYSMVDLNKLAADELPNFLDRAQTLNPVEFSAQASERVKQIREAKKTGRNAEKVNEFVALPRLKKVVELKEEYETNRNATATLEAMNAKSAMDGWKAALAFCFRMDPISQEEGRVKFERNKEIAAEEKAKKKQEREEKEAQEAAKNSAEALVS